MPCLLNSAIDAELNICKQFWNQVLWQITEVVDVKVQYHVAVSWLVTN